jgi:hypothetical protein
MSHVSNNRSYYRFFVGDSPSAFLKRFLSHEIGCERLSLAPALAFLFFVSHWLHRHPYLCIPLSSHVIRYNKRQKIFQTDVLTCFVFIVKIESNVTTCFGWKIYGVPISFWWAYHAVSLFHTRARLAR